MATATIETGPALDNLQELLKRKRELEKNKRRFHLTEADCNLLLTNANEFTFKDGQVIAQDGDTLSSVYRIKTGKVVFMKGTTTMCELGQGYFLGETVLLNNKFIDVDGCSLVARGTVTLLEMNVNFVRKLFEVDRTLALKFYRHIATKLAVIFQGILESTATRKIAARTLSSTSISTHTSTSSSSSSSSSSAPESSSVDTQPPSPPSPEVPRVDLSMPRRRLTRRQSSMITRLPYKVYTLDNSKSSVKTAVLKHNTIEIKSERLGIGFKTKIMFSQIKNFVRTSESSITILFDTNRAKTLFFKEATDLEELYGILQSIVESYATPAQKSSPTAPISSPHISSSSSSSSSPKFDEEEGVPTIEDVRRKMDCEILSLRGTRKQLKKGDVLVEEGDLYQRVYLIHEGTLATKKNGFETGTLGAGESFGMISLLNLRPYCATITVASETAEVSIVPGYKINELINSDPDLAIRLYQRTAVSLQTKLDKYVKANKSTDLL